MGHSDSESDSGASSSSSGSVLGQAKRGFQLQLICFCCCGLGICLPFIVIKAVIGYNAMSGCNELAGTGGANWTIVIPAMSDIQTPTWTEGGSLWYDTANVYTSKSQKLDASESTTVLKIDGWDDNAQPIDPKTRIGYWIDISVPFMSSRIGYQNAQDQTLIVAREPWGFYFGHNYIVERCDEGGAPYSIKEDYWNEPWFSFWSSVKLYDIINQDTGAVLAKVKGESIPHFGKLGTYAGWQATVTGADGTPVAVLQQQWNSLWSNPIWHVENLQPNLVPNTVISFIGMVLIGGIDDSSR